MFGGLWASPEDKQNLHLHCDYSQLHISNLLSQIHLLYIVEIVVRVNSLVKTFPCIHLYKIYLEKGNKGTELNRVNS